MSQFTIDEQTFEIQRKNGAYILNGQPVEPDIRQINDQLWHIIYQNRTYKVFVHKLNPQTKEVELSINGKKRTVRVWSRMEKLLADLGMEYHLHHKISELKAPMPGLIHDIKVAEGDEIDEGDPLLILEAMKMENVIKAAGEGKVAKIHVKEGSSVEKNTLLMTFE